MSDPEKARHYLEALDAARCNGRWQDVPELVRKIGKHAAKRQCLCLTAQTEHRVAKLNNQRPHTASSLASINLSQTLTPIQDAVEKEEESSEDRFQARVCLAWLHSILSEPSQVLSTLSNQDVSRAIESFTNIVSPTARWTHVCIVKGACLRGVALENSGNIKEAALFYESLFTYLSKTQSTVGNTLESNIWTERCLARHISLVSRHVKSNVRNPHIILKSKIFRPAELLGSFRLWSEYRTERQNGNFFSLAWVWKAYYDVLSILLQHQITKTIFPSKAQQYLELQKVQSAYEAIFMTDTSFPQADQSNAEIDCWVDQVMANWRALLVPSWQAEDLGQGAHLALGKNVLEILYRSAMKSFHSPRILRHLLTVHAQLSEFKLAGKALDTYLEIVAKGKARSEKSGEIESGFDDDTTTMCTAAEGIRMLCDYGNRAEAERALQITEVLQSWIDKARTASQGQAENSTKVEVSAEDNPEDLIDKQNKPKSTVPGKALSLAHCAIGISHRRWSRLTYEEDSRSDLLTTAVSNFRAALRPEYGNQDDIDVLHSLAYAFCEQRDIDSAITTAKEAISLGSAEIASQNGYPGDGATTNDRTRGTLLKCWHLLALLLSARQDFEKAMASCEAAQELYGGKTVLYGDVSALTVLASLGIAEKRGLIELKITQIALSEVLDGPEEAVNLSTELLGFYAKLFKYSEKGTSAVLQSARAVNKTDTASPPRSIRGSILGFPKDRKSKLAIGNNANTSVGSLEPSNEYKGPPAIAITSDDTVLPQNLSHNNYFLGRHESNKLKKRHSRKSLQGGSQHRSRTTSPLRPATSDGGHRYLSKRDRLSADGPSDSLSPHANPEYTANEVGLAISHDLPSSPPTPAVEHSIPFHPIPATSQNMDSKSHSYISPTAEPTPTPGRAMVPINLHKTFNFPEPQLPPLALYRYERSILVRMWCKVSMSYRNAQSNAEAQSAITEAANHVSAIEEIIATDDGSSNQVLTTTTNKVLDTLAYLWSKVQAEQGALHVQLGNRVKASQAFESALRWDPQHRDAIIGLSSILLDMYKDNASSLVSLDENSQSATAVNEADAPPPAAGSPTLAPLSPQPHCYNDDVPQHRDTVAVSARDRAYKLLSDLTKSGHGWDCPAAWFLLARAYEYSGESDMAIKAYTFVTVLELTAPVREVEEANVA